MRDWLLWLWGDYPVVPLYGELRVIGEHGYRTQRFYELPNGIDALLGDALVDDHAGLEAYVSVIPRYQKGGHATDTSLLTHTVFLDVDGKHNGGKEGALKRILDFEVPPSAIVDSGHGYHAYWRLTNLQYFDRIEPIIKGLIQRLGGDPGVHDRARILRLPGLSNHKDGGNAPVRLIRFDTTLTYRLSDLTEYAYREPPRNDVREHTGYMRLVCDERDLQQDLVTDPGKGARSEHDFGVVCRMIELGYSDEVIVQTFMSHPNGVGVKTVKNGPGYLYRTIRKAHMAVGK